MNGNDYCEGGDNDNEKFDYNYDGADLEATVVIVRGDPPVELAVQPDTLHAGT